MKKITFFILTFFVVCVALGQDREYRSSIDTIHNKGERNIGWKLSHILDNWMFDVNAGGQLYYGFEDTEGPLFKRLTGNLEGHMGRWLFPMFGIRANLGIGYARGFITKESYLANRWTIINIAGYGESEGTTTSTIISGNDTIQGGLGGYYWTYDKDDNLFIQKWKYVYGGFDMMVNLSYMKRYDKVRLDKKLNNIVYMGFNIYMGLSESHPERVGINTNLAAEGHMGYIARYALTKHLNVEADIRLSILEGLFDREKLNGIEAMTPDLKIDFMAGICYDFNLRSDMKRIKQYTEEGSLAYGTTEIPKFHTFVQTEDVDMIQKIDTIFLVLYDTINDERTFERKQQMEEERDILVKKISQIPSTIPLDSILRYNMVPYEMVFFDKDKWDIRDKEEIKIAKMARIMKAFPDSKFIIYGSADSKTGTVNRNDFLSHCRADIVYNRLIIEYGIDPNQMTREYLGGILDYDPFILNRTAVIIMDHPAVIKGFNEMKAKHKAGGNIIKY